MVHGLSDADQSKKANFGFRLNVNKQKKSDFKDFVTFENTTRLFTFQLFLELLVSHSLNQSTEASFLVLFLRLFTLLK